MPDKGIIKPSKHGIVCPQNSDGHMVHSLADGHPCNPESYQRGEKNTNTKEQKSNRNIIIKFRVNEEEFHVMEKKFKNSGMRSRSDFIRLMIFEGIIVRISEDEIRKITRLVNNIASSINQIAVRVNSTGSIYAEDFAEIREGQQKIWQQLRYFQSQLQRQKR